MPDMKLWAHAYARLGWPVFRITGFKTPLKGSHGHLDATADPAAIEAWWTERPAANLAVALGDIVVIDADGPGAMARLKGILAAHNWVPDTAIARTSRGLHLYFRAPPGAHIRTRNEPRQKSGDDGIDIKAHGGWTVLPPSVNAKSGFVYKWIRPLPLSELPAWLLTELMPNDNSNKSGSRSLFDALGPLPPHLQQTGISDGNVTQKALEALRTEYSPSEQARLESALKAIPTTCGYDQFLQIGMALKELDWERSDGTSIAFDVWDQWCAQSPHYNQAGLEAKWNSFKRSGVTVGTVYHLARQHGWNGGVPEPLTAPYSAPASADAPNHLNGHASAQNTLPAAFLAPSTAIFFPDVTEDGKPRATCTNAAVAVTALGIECAKDLFHEKMLVGGHVINQWAGDLSDDVIQMIRKLIRYRYGFDPKTENARDACVQLCLEHQFDPVLDYLDDLAWDGTPRLDRWLATYMGAADTELNHAIGRLALIAAVRRARKPGTKFDQIVVLEGPEGKGKSLAIETLAGRPNFSDGKILGLGDREQQEATAGVWLYEIAELTGMRRAEIEHVKAFASRTVDRARPAYGRFRVDRPRRTIFFATTNRDDYLQSDTGNRRFWPVATSTIDLVALARDRDQIWAEAAVCEARGDSIGLPERLWRAAGEKQGERLEGDEWFELIARWISEKKKLDVSVTEVLCDNQYIRRQPDSVTRGDAIRTGVILKRLNYQRYHQRVAGGFMWRYRLSEPV